MKDKYTKEQIEEAFTSLISNQSLMKTSVGALLGLIIGIIIYLTFAYIRVTIAVLLFLPPLLVGFLAGYLGKPYETKFKILIFLIGALTYFIGLYWIFIAHNYILIALTPIAGFIAVYGSTLHLTDIQKRAIWKKQYE